MSEICGDAPLGAWQRLAYLVRNALANLFASGCPVVVRRFCAPRSPATPGAASPSRALTEAFLGSELPALLPVGPIRVLEIGCGSGRLCAELAALGYWGSYLGIDLGDRFDHTPVPGFSKNFLHADALAYAPEGNKFDLVISVSALEHIPNETALINRIPGWLADGGIEIHFVPSGWGLLTYLWHGWRQYPLRRIGARFGVGTTAVALGGLTSTLVHILWITVGEMLLRLPARRRWGKTYQRMVDRALRIDETLSFCPTMYAVLRRHRGN